MRHKIKLTHKGWFGVCPVYFANLYSEAPVVIERHWVFLPLFILSEWFFGACFFLASLVNPHFEPEWALRVTGEIEE